MSGVVVASAEQAGEGPRDIVAYAHGSTGLYDACAPSSSIDDFPWTYGIMVPEVIDAGYVYVAADYEGRGTPGMHRYLMGTSEGRGVLDIIRAAQQIEEANAGDRAVLVVDFDEEF